MTNNLRDVLTSIGDYSIVLTRGRKIGNKPMYSEGFCYCQGIVLFGKEEVGMAHVLPDEEVTPDIDYFLENMEGVSSAVLLMNTDFNGWRKNFLEQFSKNKIPILNIFRGVEYELGYGMHSIHRRKMLVIPSKKEVFVESDLGLERWVGK